MLKSPFAGFGWPYKACWWPSKACWCASKGCKRRFLLACFGKIVRFFGEVIRLLWWSHLVAFVKRCCFFRKVSLLSWQGHLAAFVKWRCFLGDVIALHWQSHCASLAMSLRFWGEWSKLLVFCEGNCWRNVLLVRGGVWSGFFACRMQVGRFVEIACWRFLPCWRGGRTSKNENLMPWEIQMKRFGNWKWNASKITDGLV